MLTGIVVGAGIMLTYLALFGLAGRRLRRADDGGDAPEDDALLHRERGV